MDKYVETVVRKHLAYCQANNWAGIDPYDALNSRLLDSFPFLDSRIPRIALTQLLKRSPINLRSLLRIEPTQNPKALAIFLSAFVKLKDTGVTAQEYLIGQMIERIIALRSPGTSYWCWGYSFPWQGRTVLTPRWEPNLVCTYFVASALLDAYEQIKDERCLDMAVSSAEYMLNELYWTEGPSDAAFCYPMPGVRSHVHNANFLAAALLLRVHSHTGDDRFRGPALKAARYAAAQQQPDGSWHYGELPSQRWNDNFHTGFNLCALRSIGQYGETTEFESALRRGMEFYLARFFREDGAVRYFSDRTYPIDSHCVAQSISTLLALKDLDPGNAALADKVFRWAMKHLWDEQGFFYYRALRFFTIRTPYMRWTQAWMFLAISTLLAESAAATQTVTTDRSAAPLEA